MTQKVIAGTGKFVPTDKQMQDIDDNFDELYDDGVFNIRKRFTLAEVNAGAEILPAVAGKSYRMIGCNAIAYGGAMGALTTVDVLGTLSSERKLVAYAQASLTQSAVLKDGETGAAVLADGASYLTNDANTALDIGVTGTAGTTATGVDINLMYGIE